MDQNFSPMIRSTMHYHNIHHNEIKQDEKVKNLLAKVENIRDVMGRNIHMLLQRGEKFDDILAKSDKLNMDAQVFKKNAKHTKQILCRRYYFTCAVLSFIILALLYMSLVGVCGFDLSRCKNKGQSNSYNTNNFDNNAGGNAQGNNDAGGGN
jgi:vesicle-associated membrane protein 7